ncbi:MAG TPA: tyrosine-type recombinase/integrase [Pyrinomonadaceae bacterium]|nr:tyrosine-type recombinase/integrase [Pyrinomonadaceae bacterium]
MPKERTGYIGKDKQGKWFARVTLTGTNGKRRNIARRAASKPEARQILKAMVRQIEGDGEKVIDTARLTFNDLADFYAAKYLKAAEYRHERKVSGLRALDTAERALALFREHFGVTRLANISYGDIYNFRAKRLDTDTQYKRPRSIASINRELVVLRRILNIAVRENWISRNPFNCGDSLISSADENKRERILSRDEEARLFAAIDAEPKREHLQGILLLALDCALRRGEIFTLKWSDISLDSKTVTVRAFNCKTARSRTVAMTERVYNDLNTRWEQSRKEINSLVFGVRVTVSTSFAKACRAAGVNDFHLHDCRHTAITRMIRAGIPPVEVMRVSGHQTLSCLYRYANLSDDSVFRVATALDTSYAANQTTHAQGILDLPPAQLSVVQMGGIQ